MTEENQPSRISYFDRAIGALHDKPDVIKTRATTMRVIPWAGLESYVYVVQTFRQHQEGDSIFIENVSDTGTMRLVIPPAVADVIARQRDQLTKQSRSRAGKKRAEEMKAAGIKPGFMRGK